MGNHKRHLIPFTLILALLSGRFPLNGSSLSRALVESANRYEMEQMASLRGLSISGVDDTELRSRLLQSIGGIADSEESSEGDEQKPTYTMTIEQANKMVKQPDGSLVTLLGNVKSLILLSQNEKEKRLEADKVIVDTSHSIFSAMGTVSYADLDSDAPVQEMQGDIITYDWDASLLKISGGTTKSERKNSEDEAIEFYTTGDEISYDTKQGLIYFKNGYITNNPVHAYSSISAKKLAIMDSGDMFMQNAYISIGRVPVLWLPFFLFPAARMWGNPAIGTESERGWFVNTSFEVYGSYPDIGANSSSSFTRLLQNEDGGTKVLDGPVYRSLREGEELGKFQKWAQDTGSYLVILADSYQNSGLVLGMVTENNLFGKRLSFKFDGKVATNPNGYEKITTYGAYPKTRYSMENEIAVKTSCFTFTFTMPMYSDPKVKRTYSNRFTNFSLDHLWGAEWPTTYTSEVTSYVWKTSATFKLPSSWSNSFVQSFSISTAEASATYKWQRGDDNTYQYTLSSVTLPSLKATMSGTLLSLSEKKETVEATKTQLEIDEEEEEIQEQSEVTADPLVNEMIASAFRAKSSSTATKSKARSLSLTYSLSENLTQTGSSLNSKFDWENTQYRYNDAKGSFLLSSVADPNWLSFSEEITPAYTSTYDATKTNRETNNFTLSSTTKSSIPILGLSYQLTQKLYTYNETTTYDKTTKELSSSSETHSGEFNKEYVTTHQLSLSKSFSLPYGTLQPSMTWVLPPLTQSVVPQLTYKVGHFTFTGSYKFLAQEEGGPLEHDLISLSLGFDDKYLSSSLKATYQTQKIRSDEFWYPFESQGALALHLFGLTLSGSYDYLNDNDTYGMHYFNSLSSGASFGPLKSAFTWKGPRESLEKYTWISSLDIAQGKLVWWKRRITFTCGLSSSLTINYQNHYATNLSFNLDLGFSIAEFLDVKFSMKSANTSFFTYYENDEFQWNLMWQDLARSFDVINGGIHKTNFNLSALGLEIVHHMDDWTLNCKYTGSVVLSDNQYSWVPVISVFLQWKTLPELKVDENWTKKTVDSPWKETSSVYSE